MNAPWLRNSNEGFPSTTSNGCPDSPGAPVSAASYSSWPHTIAVPPNTPRWNPPPWFVTAMAETNHFSPEDWDTPTRFISHLMSYASNTAPLPNGHVDSASTKSATASTRSNDDENIEDASPAA